MKRFIIPVVALGLGLILGCSGSSSPGVTPNNDTLETNVTDVLDSKEENDGIYTDADVETRDMELIDGSEDIMPDEVLSVDSDVGKCPGAPGCECERNEDCYNNLCVDGPNGQKQCARTCSGDSECGEGYKCVAVANAGGDQMYICVYRFANLCRPCEDDKDCKIGYLRDIAKCIELGPQGSFCGIECKDTTDCPDGYTCKDGQCQPSDGECECTDYFKKAGFKTKCYKENDYGKCWGERTCDSECSAMTPAKEVCNGIDDNCNGYTDEGLDSVPCEKKNEFGTCKGTAKCVAGKLVDCSAPEPAKEECNGKDDNCDGYTDEGFADTDGDGIADCVDDDIDGDGVKNDQDNCPLVKNPDQKDMDGDGKGDACDDDIDGDGDPNDTDCAPKDPEISHKATEKCDGKDDNCNGQTDEEGADGCVEYYLDADEDGYGDRNKKKCLCSKDDVNHYTATKAGDCDDSDPNINPGEREVCNSKDDNCDGQTDEEGAINCTTYYKDTDHDGYGILSDHKCLCKPEGDYSASSPLQDCNDTDKDIHPNAPEKCNNVDDNCNGQIDEGVLQTFYKDNDGDGYGNPADSIKACPAADGRPPKGYADNGDDCNDFNPDIHPGAKEVCNDVDDDCNGKVDDGLPLLTIYKDNDGDGFAAKNAVSQKKCNAPIGWTTAKDIDGDGNPDWDCDDSKVNVHPGAPEVCGNGVDDNCNGYTDRLCFTPCGGNWPFRFKHSNAVRTGIPVDLNGDGQMEIIAQDSLGIAILENNGNPVYAYSQTSDLNYSRGRAIVADVDNYDQFGPKPQSLEVLTGNGSHAVYYFVDMDNKTVTTVSGYSVYDASKFMAEDINHDGKVEFFAGTWCDPDGTRIFNYDRQNKKIVMIKRIMDPDNQCEYGDGRVLTDLNGDGIVEYIFGSGYGYPTSPSTWSGKIYAIKFTDLNTLDYASYCSNCFPTQIEGLYAGGVGTIYRYGDTIRAGVSYFKTHNNGPNTGAGSRYWAWGLDGKVLQGYPKDDNNEFLPTDIDDDGKEDYSWHMAYYGLWDVNGDGYPDKVDTIGPYLQVALWNPKEKKFDWIDYSKLKVSGNTLHLRGIWDIDGDGRLEVLASEGTYTLYCYKLGKDTWHPFSSLPPYFTPLMRTYQLDNFEPNDGKDTNGDGLPDQYIQIPSAATSGSWHFYSYLSSATDKDYYLVNTGWGATVCLKAPKNRDYVLEVYSFRDKWNNETHEAGKDGKPDGLVWSKSTGKGGKVCFDHSKVYPSRSGEYKFIVGIRSNDGSYSPYWPYWLYTKSGD